MSKCQFKIMTNNFITQKKIDNGTITFSSEDSVKLFKNSFDDCRSSLWKPTGYFKIDLTNNLIIYNGATTITINPQIFTTPQDLITIVQPQLPAGVSLTYTNNIFKFSNTAGMKLFNFSNQVNTIWKTLGFLLEVDTNINSANPAEADIQAMHQLEFVELDLKVPTVVDFVAGIYLIDKESTISSQAVITLKADNLPDQWDNPIFQTEVQHDDRGFFKILNGDEFYRYWRLEIRDPLNHLGYIELSNLYMGSSTDFHAVARGISRMQVDRTNRIEAERGDLFHVEKIKYEEFNSISLDNMSQEDRLKLEQIFNDVGISKPFYVSLDPYLNIGKNYSDYTRFVRFKNDINKQHLFLEYYKPSFSLIEVI